MKKLLVINFLISILALKNIFNYFFIYLENWIIVVQMDGNIS